MSLAYDLVRDAVRGTTLESQLDTIAMRLHLTSDSPDWIIGAVAAIAVQSTREATDALEARIASAIAAAIHQELDAKWRADLGSAIAGAVVASAATKIAEPTEKAVTTIATSAKQFIVDADAKLKKWKALDQPVIVSAILAAVLVALSFVTALHWGDHNANAAGYTAGEQYAVAAERQCVRATGHLCGWKGRSK